MVFFRGIILILLIFGNNFNLLAQREVIENLPNFDLDKVHWGYYLGINQKSFKISYLQPSTKIVVEDASGFNVGLIGDLRLHNNINLRLEPGLSTNTKKLYFSGLQGQDSVRETGGTYFHFPLVLKISANRYNNIRPYVLGGIAYDYNFSSNEKILMIMLVANLG